LGNSFFRLVLECIRAWSIFYPNDQDFVGVYNGLIKEKVKFPDDMNYYKPQDLKPKETVTQKPKDDVRASQSSNNKNSDKGGPTKTSQTLPKTVNYGRGEFFFFLFQH
jgi:hypothetical protein